MVDQRQPPYSWVVMGQLWGMDLMNVIVFSSIGVLLPYWREEMGVTPLQAGMLGAAGFLGFGVMALPASIWLTRYNPRLVTLVATVLMAVMALGQALAPTILLLMVTRFFFVLVSVCRIQMQVIFIQQWFQPRLYAMINSLDFGNRSLGQTLGVAAIPPLIGLLGSWRNSYMAVAIALAVLSIVWVFFGRERRRTQQEGGPPPQVGSPAGVLRRHKVLWVIAGCQIGAAVVFASFLTFYPTYAIDSMGISRTVAGLTMGFFSVGAMVGSLAAGPLSQMTGRRKPFIWVPGLVLPVCYIALLQVDSVTYAMMLLFLAGVLCHGCASHNSHHSPGYASAAQRGGSGHRSDAHPVPLQRDHWAAGGRSDSGDHRIPVHRPPDSFAYGHHVVHRRQAHAGDRFQGRLTAPAQWSGDAVQADGLQSEEDGASWDSHSRLITLQRSDGMGRSALKGCGEFPVVQDAGVSSDTFPSGTLTNSYTTPVIQRYPEGGEKWKRLPGLHTWYPFPRLAGEGQSLSRSPIGVEDST